MLPLVALLLSLAAAMYDESSALDPLHSALASASAAKDAARHAGHSPASVRQVGRAWHSIVEWAADMAADEILVHAVASGNASAVRAGDATSRRTRSARAR